MNTIRKLEKKDIGRCLQICKENFEILKYDRIDDVEKKLMESLNEDNIAQLQYFVFEEDGIIKWFIGIANVIFAGYIFGVTNLYVAVEHQNKGIGSALLKYLINKAKERKGEILFLDTQKEWYFKKFGFKTIDSPCDDGRYVMQLNLM